MYREAKGSTSVAFGNLRFFVAKVDGIVVMSYTFLQGFDRRSSAEVTSGPARPIGTGAPLPHRPQRG
jgi:hypothetical protein